MTVTSDIEICVAPTERHPAMVRIAHKISNLPEQYGCDAIWRSNGQWWGIQRKEVKDFIASVTDGRLAKELGQMKGHVTIPLVVIEGKLQWTSDGTLLNGSGYGRPITKTGYHGMLFSIVHEGANVFFTGSTDETAELIQHLAAWSQKETHTSLKTRPGPDQQSVWGKATNEDWARHFLQGFPGIGAGMAQAIIDHFGGIPLQWTVSIPELLKVPGIGKARAKALIDTFKKEEHQ